VKFTYFKATSYDKQIGLYFILGITRGYRERMAFVKTKIAVNEIRKNRILFAMAAPSIILTFVMAYLPMSGLVLAFKNYRYDKGVFASAWNGFDNFAYLFSSGSGWLITRNTILYNILNLGTCQLLAILIAIVISEMPGKIFKKTSQSVIFLPYFISWVIVGTFIYNIFNYETGVMNNTLRLFGHTEVNVYSMPWIWPWIICMFNSWKWSGYNSIIYIAAITSIDSERFEAAEIDGANIFQRIHYITFPSIKPTIITMLLLQVGGILRGDFQMFYQIIGRNGQLYNATDVIDTYVFRSLVSNANMGMTAAATFYQSFICFVIIVAVNAIVKKIDADYALF
jgi:putative aldouronate transport system permease protein